MDLRGCDPYKIQCKRLAKYVSVVTIEEIQCDRAFGDVPVLVTAGNDQEAMAVLPLSEFVKLVSAAAGGSSPVESCFRCEVALGDREGKEFDGQLYCPHCYNRKISKD